MGDNHPATPTYTVDDHAMADTRRAIRMVNAPAVQGASGDLKAAGEIKLSAITLDIPRDVADALVVSLDTQPLATSKRMLLQVMTEEKATGFRTEPAGDRRHRITSIGQNPWLIRKLEGTIRLHRPDAAKLRVTVLDQIGQPTSTTMPGDFIKLQPETLYYLIEAR